MFKRLVIAVVLLGLVVGGIVWFKYFRDGMISSFLAGMTPPAVPVTVATAEPADWVPGIDAIGTSFSVQGVDLAIESGGLVREILFTANDQVERQELLVQIDDSSEAAALAAAQAALRVAETDLSRARTLNQRGVSAETTVDSADAQASSARANVAQVQTELEHKRLTAPFAGEIGIPQIEVGQYVSVGTVYATLQDLTRMRVDFDVPEQDIAQIKRGGPITVSTEIGSLTLPGTITAIEPKIDAGSRMVTVRAEVENADGKLIPGQFLRVRVELPREAGVIALPLTAVSSTLYGDTVYVLRGDGDDLTAEQVFVTTGRRFGGRIEVAKGIEDGDRVVTSGQNRLTSGAKVKIDDSVTLNTNTGQ